MKLLKENLMKAFCALLAVAVLAGCATIDRTRFDDPTLRLPPDPLTLEVGHEVLLLRVDLKRQRLPDASVRQRDGTSQASMYEPYHYLVADLGNGLIVDKNRNLSLDLNRFYDLSASRRLQVTRHAIAKNETPFTVEKFERGFERVIPGLFPARTIISLSENSVTVAEGELFRGTTRISIRENGMDLSLGALLVLGGDASVSKLDERNLVFSGMVSHFRLTRLDNGRISAENAWEMIHHADRIEFKYRGVFGAVSRYYFVRTETGCLFFNAETYAGVEVSKTGNRIDVFRNGVPVDAFTVIQEP